MCWFHLFCVEGHHRYQEDVCVVVDSVWQSLLELEEQIHCWDSEE